MPTILHILILIGMPILGWKLIKFALPGFVSMLSLVAVVAVMAPGAYAAAKAEAALPKGKVMFDYNGNDRDAKLFNTIVKDRMRRTQVAALRPDLAYTATRFGRGLAGAEG